MATKRSPLKTEVTAILIGIGIYLLLQLLLAVLAVKGWLPETALSAAQILCCGLCSLIIGLLSARKLGIGTLTAALISTAVFALLLILIGFLAFDSVNFIGRGGGLLLAALVGGVLAGLLSSGKRKKAKGKRVLKK